MLQTETLLLDKPVQSVWLDTLNRFNLEGLEKGRKNKSQVEDGEENDDRREVEDEGIKQEREDKQPTHGVFQTKLLFKFITHLLKTNYNLLTPFIDLTLNKLWLKRPILT